MKIEHPFIKEIQNLSKKIEETKSILLNKEGSKKIYTNDDFCNLMGISKETAKSWRKQGKITYSLVGKQLYYTMENIYCFLDAHIENKKKE